jgi:hypothetical protein
MSETWLIYLVAVNEQALKAIEKYFETYEEKAD